MAGGKPSLLIVCGTRHRPDEARRFVDSIVAHTGDCDWWAYMPDARDLGGPRFVYDHPRVRVFEERPRRWLSDGMHRMVQFAEYDLGVELPDWFCWLNDDIEVEAGWARTAIDALERAPRAGMAALPYLTPHEPEGYHVNYFPTPGLLYANFGVFHRSVWRRVGGFDRRVPFYGLDNMLAFRMYEAGLAILPVAGSRLVHHYQTDRVRDENQRLRAGVSRGWEELKGPYLARVGEFQQVQARLGPIEALGFELRQSAWCVRGDSTTYARRFPTGGTS